MKIIPNQADVYCEQIKQDLMKIHDDLITMDNEYPHDKFDKIINQIEIKISKVKECINGFIDIGGIVENLVKPNDIVKIEYDNGTSCYCFEVKIGRRKPKYYYCGNFIH